MTSEIVRQCASTAGHHARRTCRRFFSAKSRLNSESYAESQPKEQDGNETYECRPSQLLPRSPLITHPRPGADKRRKRRPLPEELDALQTNPWAVALASPVRMCSVTGTRLPRAFLNDYELVERSNSDKLWFLPTSLVRDELRKSQSTTRLAQFQNRTGRTATEAGDDRRSSITTVRAKTLRIAARLPLLKKITEFLASSNGKKKSSVSRIVPTRWKYPLGPITRDVEVKMIWREDMADLTLRAMRRDAVKKLESVCSRFDEASRTSNDPLLPLEVEEYSGEGISRACTALKDLDRLECGAVLVIDFPERQISSTEGDRPSDHILKSTLPDLVTLAGKSSKVPIFDLTALLAKDDLTRVKQYLPQPEVNAFFLRPQDAVDVEATLSLWKLRNFVREDIR